MYLSITSIMCVHSCITCTELFVGVFGTKCCMLYLNRYSISFSQCCTNDPYCNLGQLF